MGRITNYILVVKGLNSLKDSRFQCKDFLVSVSLRCLLINFSLAGEELEVKKGNNEK